MSISRILFFLLLVLSPGMGHGQDDIPVVPPDSSRVIIRPFDETVVEELQKNPELDYAQTPAAISLWERFKIWLNSWIGRLLDAAFNTNWVSVLIALLAVVALVYVILRLMKVDALKMFYGTASSVKYGVLEEDIHTMDFEKLLSDALQQKEYRLAIRLSFLHALKLLSDKHHIHWQPGKTNHDYLNELTVQDLKTGFNELNFYFEYAWYGNFKINAELYAKVNSLFTTWRTNV